MLSVKDKVGALYDLLRPFASHGLSMTKIESRPSRRKAWEYIFFVDIEGHIEEERVKKAVDEITGLRGVNRHTIVSGAAGQTHQKLRQTA